MKKSCLTTKPLLLIGVLLLVNIQMLNAQTKFIKEYSLDFYEAGLGSTHMQHLDKNGTGYVIGGPVFQTSFSTPGGTYSIYDPTIMTVTENGSPGGLCKKYHVIPPSGGYASFFHAGIKRIYSKSDISCDGYLLFGKMNFADEMELHEDFQRGTLIKTDLDGNVVWTKKMSFVDNEGKKKPFEITHAQQVKSGNIIVLGFYYELNKENRQCVIMRINPVNGLIEWHREINSIEGLDNDMIPNGMIEDSQGEYYIYGLGNRKKTGFVLNINDGWFVPISFSLCSFNLPGSAEAVGIEVDDQDLIIGGTIAGITLPNSRLFVVRINKELNSIRDLAGNINKSTTYGWDEQIIASDLYLNNEKIVLSAMIYGGDLVHTPVNLNIASSGIILNQTRGDLQIYRNRSKSIFEGTESYVTGDNLILPRFRLTSRSASGSTCSEGNINMNQAQLNAFIKSEDILFFSPTLLQDAFQVAVENDFVTVFTKCEDCFISSEDVDPITTSTGETAFCEGESIDLIAPSGFVSYQWFQDGEPIETEPIITAHEGGDYSVICYDANGCEVEIFIKLLEYERCKINYGFPNVYYCSLKPDSPVWVGWAEDPLKNCNGEYDFNWTYNGSPVPSYYPVGDEATLFVGPGTYEVTITTPCNSYVFSQFITDNLITYVNHSYALPTFSGYSYVSGTHAKMKMVNYSTDFDEYIWDVVNISTGESWTLTTGYPEEMEVPYTPGSGEILQITLTLTDISSCKVYKNMITWSDGAGITTGNNPSTGMNVRTVQSSIYPNPVDHELTIKINCSPDTSAIIIITDAMGNLIYNDKIFGSLSFVNTKTFKSGIYFIKVMHENQEADIHKLIVTH